jgi:hypothetical protein
MFQTQKPEECGKSAFGSPATLFPPVLSTVFGSPATLFPPVLSTVFEIPKWPNHPNGPTMATLQHMYFEYENIQNYVQIN